MRLFAKPFLSIDSHSGNIHSVGGGELEGLNLAR